MLPAIYNNIARDSTILFRESSLIYSPLNYQSVRWKRKPRWLPVAKSKMFRVPERKVLPEYERGEIQKLFNNYRTEMKSLKEFFAEKTRSSETGEEVIAEQLKLEEEENQRCVKLNDEWNANVASLRLARVSKEKEEELERIIKEIEENKRIQEARKLELEALVRQEKERAKTFITPQNIDEAIEKALSSVVDYEFGIDLEGNKYVGRNTKPGQVEKPKNLMADSSV